MRIVILGATGLIGHKLYEQLTPIYTDVFAILHRNKDKFSKYRIYDNNNVIDNIDIDDFKLLEGILKALQPDVIINCIGITKRHPESSNYIKCLTLNSLLPHWLAEWVQRNDARLIIFGTDCVFNGKEGKYTESSQPTAKDLYGRTKYLGEVSGKNCLTLRTSFIGRELTPFTELLEWFIAQNGKTVKGFTKAMYSGVSTIYLSRLVVHLLDNYENLSGLYHLSSEAISKYNLLCMARDAFKLNIEIVADDTFHCDRTLISDKLRSVADIKVPSWKEMMNEIASDTKLYS